MTNDISSEYPKTVTSAAEGAERCVADASVEKYGTYLKDMYRPPSRGGNTRAWHQHVLTINGVTYSFLALGAKKWVYEGDSVSFMFETTKEGYRNIIKDSIVTKDKTGAVVVRGERGNKPWRTATTRLPASRREQRDQPIASSGPTKSAGK